MEENSESCNGVRKLSRVDNVRSVFMLVEPSMD